MKSKRILVFTLVLTLVFSVISITGTYAASVTASPDNVMPGNEISVTVSEKPENGWIGFYKEGAKNDQYDEFVYISNLPADGIYRIKAPTTYGKYNFRLFSDSGYDTLVATSNTVTIGQVTAASITATPINVVPGDEIKITFDGITQTQIDDNAWIGFYKESAKDNQYNEFKYIRDLPADNIYRIKAPTEYGNYNFRLFRNSEYNKVATSGTVTVSGRQATLDVSPKVAAKGQPVTLTVGNVPDTPEYESAWVGVYKAGAKDDQYVDFKYISALPQNNTWEFKLDEPGKYHFRVFCDSGYTLPMGTGGDFEVTTDSYAGPNLDTASSWAKPEITGAYAEGLTTSSVLTDFAENITREEFCELAVKLHERMSGEKAAPVEVNPFKDTNNSEILKAYKLGIVNGTSSTTFSPNAGITRQEIAVMLLRTLKNVMPKLDTSAKFATAFKDEGDIAAWALEALKFFNANEIIKGSEVNKQPFILPKGFTTREQGIALVKRTFDKFCNL